MRPLTKYLSLVALAGIAAPAAGQTRDSTDLDRRQAALLLDHTFTAPINEPIRVFLAKDVTYRVETQGAGIRLELKSLLKSAPAPLLQQLTAGTSASSGALYVVTPRVDGVYVITTAGGDAQQPVRVRVYAVPPKGKTKP